MGYKKYLTCIDNQYVMLLQLKKWGTKFLVAQKTGRKKVFF